MRAIGLCLFPASPLWADQFSGLASVGRIAAAPHLIKDSGVRVWTGGMGQGVSDQTAGCTRRPLIGTFLSEGKRKGNSHRALTFTRGLPPEQRLQHHSLHGPTTCSDFDTTRCTSRGRMHHEQSARA
jgi:hypothetical protein